MIERFKVFLREVRGEINRITWPKRLEVYGTTAVVIATCFIFGFFLWAVDLVMGRLVTWMYSYFG
jgi:preprotein translocase subunit SecE